MALVPTNIIPNNNDNAIRFIIFLLKELAGTGMPVPVAWSVKQQIMRHTQLWPQTGDASGEKWRWRGSRSLFVHG
jgi:hypothetical protein